MYSCTLFLNSQKLQEEIGYLNDDVTAHLSTISTLKSIINEEQAASPGDSEVRDMALTIIIIIIMKLFHRRPWYLPLQDQFLRVSHHRYIDELARPSTDGFSSRFLMKVAPQMVSIYVCTAYHLIAVYHLMAGKEV